MTTNETSTRGDHPQVARDALRLIASLLGEIGDGLERLHESFYVSPDRPDRAEVVGAIGEAVDEAGDHLASAAVCLEAVAQLVADDAMHP